MNSPRPIFLSILERVLPWGVLALLLALAYARFFVSPYAGFDWDSTGRVVNVFETGLAGNQVLKGDRLLAVGAVTSQQFEADFRQQLFAGARPGDVIPILVDRNGAKLNLNWVYPGRTTAQLYDDILSPVWLAFVFFLIGAGCLSQVRPKGVTWALGVAASFLTAVWIMTIGQLADYHVWYSAYLLRFAVWFCAAAYLQFHWMWPRPLRGQRLPLAWLPYLVAALVATGECIHWLPPDAFEWGITIMMVGDAVLLALHARSGAGQERSELLHVLFFGVVGMLMLASIPYLESVLPSNPSQLMGLMGMPVASTGYFLVIFRRGLGDLQWRADRRFSLYVFLAVLGLIISAVIAVAVTQITSRRLLLMVGALTGLTAALAAILGYPSFQALIERRLIGLPVASSKLVGTYADRITGCASLAELASCLRHEVLPSLLVHQFAFLHIDEGRVIPILVTGGLTDDGIPDDAAMHMLLHWEGQDRGIHSARQTEAYPWIRLILPLRLKGALIAVWLLGARDADDTYSRGEIQVIQTLANETAVALSNIVQAQRLQELYRANVSRAEEERMLLALTLHDSVLNYMAAMMMKVDGSAITPAFQESFAALSERVRGIVSDLRPPMLDYGLGLAFEELVEKLGERFEGRISLSLTPERSGARYPPQVELHLLRIVQEGCENALRHAQAGAIRIEARLELDHADLTVEDDGTGFEMPDGPALQALIARKSFGLAGLLERAYLIGAQVRIDSALGHGTRLHVSWEAADA